MLARIRLELQRHGWAGLRRKALGRLWRARDYELFAATRAQIGDVPAPAAPGAGGAGTRFIVIRQAELDAAADLIRQAQALDVEVADYIDDVRRGRAVAVFAHAQGELQHYAFMFVRNRTACLLGLPAGAALIGNAYTVPQARGRGLQGQSVRLRARAAFELGFRAVYAETAPDNLPSQRGMLKAGMLRAGRLSTFVLLNRLVLRSPRPADFEPFGWCD
jgi:RimJ/RimL family protein N-acetyltransferase